VTSVGFLSVQYVQMNVINRVWIHLAQDRVKFRSVMNVAMNIF
jgi:hypothetical protein